MAARIAWLLNLDAELELAAPTRYRPAPAMSTRIDALRARMELLLCPDDAVITRGVRLGDEFSHALAFCPTPSALVRIEAAGLPVPRAPGLEVLTRVNSRAFCAELGQTLPGARYVRSFEQLLAVLDSADSEARWLLKRDFSFAGRERRRVDGGRLDASTEGFARRSFARGEGLQVEPFVARTHDFAQHGFVLQSGDVLRGEPLAQLCDAQGSWQYSRAPAEGELAVPEREALDQACREVGEALARAGYSGPFGVDAYRYHTAGTGCAFQPRSELNARFSMGYPRALLERALRIEAGHDA